jgi:hypothetical protein
MTAIPRLMTHHEWQFDFAFLRRLLLGLAALGFVLAPFSRDPLALAVGTAVPWLIVTIIDKPSMPSVVIFFLLWQWAQVYARLLLALVDGEALGAGVYGSDVTLAYWYSLASIVVLAAAFSLALSRMNVSEDMDRHGVPHWRPDRLFALYIAAWVVSVMATRGIAIAPGLAQPLGVIGQVKIAILFILFATVISSGTGGKWLTWAVLLEVVAGFMGLFSGFKEVFIILALAALSMRMILTPRTLLIATSAAAALMVLLLFWTAIKADYRQLSSGYSDTQAVTASVFERTGWLLGQAMSPSEIEWQASSVQLLRRLAYIDFFGAAIGVSEAAPEAIHFERWRDALEHVTQPRFLFPGKAVLDDTAIFVRLTGDSVSEDRRAGTSISVGYLAENFVDFGFPAMLLPVFVIGLLLGLMVRYFLTRPVPWVVGEAFAVACLLTVSAGIEISLAKVLGGVIVAFLVLALILKFMFPSAARWLE